jgi:hypothetical protein
MIESIDDRHRGILTDTFQRKELNLRNGENMDAIFTELSKKENNRNTIDGFKSYLSTYFQHHAEIDTYHQKSFFRKARQTKFMARQRILAQMLDAIFSTDPAVKIGQLPKAPHNRPTSQLYIPGVPTETLHIINCLRCLPEISFGAPLEYSVLESMSSGVPTETLHIIHCLQNLPKISFGAPLDYSALESIVDADAALKKWPPVVAWGSAKFGGKKGYRPTPNKLLAQYVSRYTLVIMMPEMRTSIQSLCTMDCIRRTVPLTGTGKCCDHRQRPTYVKVQDNSEAGGGIKKKRIMTCLVKHDGKWRRLSDLPTDHPEYVASINDQPVIKCHHWDNDAPPRTFSTIRHRVCPHVSIFDEIWLVIFLNQPCIYHYYRFIANGC